MMPEELRTAVLELLDAAYEADGIEATHVEVVSEMRDYTDAPGGASVGVTAKRFKVRVDASNSERVTVAVTSEGAPFLWPE